MDYSIKMLPIYSVGLLFLTFLSISYYYDNFGIEIANYIEISELFVLSLPYFKYIILALGIICLPLLIPAIFTFLAFIFNPHDKEINEAIDERLNNDSPGSTNPPIRAEIIEKIKAEMGFHLISEIKTIIKEIKKKKLDRALIQPVIIVAFMVGVFGYFLSGAVRYFLDEVILVRTENIEFAKNPLIHIFMLVTLPIMILYMLCQLFAAKALWQVFFKPLFNERVLPIVFFLIFLITATLFNYSNVLKVKYNQLTPVFKVFSNDHLMVTNAYGYKFIGRTKNYMFLQSKEKLIKIVNISEADSIIQIFPSVTSVMKSK